jgi:hypothetical protein
MVAPKFKYKEHLPSKMLKNILLTLTVLTAALVVAACGSSSEPVQVQTTEPAPVPAVPNAPAPNSTVAAVTRPPASSPPAPAAVVPTQPPVSEVKIGNSVGDRAPDFEFSLSDGTKVTSASLVEQAEPAYLFFFATW